MRTINLDLKGKVDFFNAEEAAKKALTGAGEKVTLVAWSDRLRDMEGPMEACARESWKCARVYAENHSADVRISVNNDDYEFYFAGIPAGFTELDQEELLDVHEQARMADFDDVQGG